MVVNLRNGLCWLLASLLILLGFVGRALRRVKRGEMVLSVYFHNPTKKEFEACVKWLKSKNLSFLRLEDVDRIIQEGAPLPKGAVLLSVDDGWMTNEENIAEVANKYKVPVAIFVSTEPVEDGNYWWSYARDAKRRKISCLPVNALKRMPNRGRLLEVAKLKELIHLKREALTIAQVKRIAASAYVTIGGHTHTHPILINCTDKQVYEELLHSKKKLEQWTGKEVAYFAYPNGDFGVREVQILQQLDYRLAFCNEPRPFTPHELQNPYLLPRCGYLEGASFAENICRMAGIWQPLVRKFKAPLANKDTEVAHSPIPDTTSSPPVVARTY
jgi:poly-beta-1,6-N-acetyl-D-glucosamine N-deacetylase